MYAENSSAPPTAINVELQEDREVSEGRHGTGRGETVRDGTSPRTVAHAHELAGVNPLQEPQHDEGKQEAKQRAAGRGDVVAGLARKQRQGAGQGAGDADAHDDRDGGVKAGHGADEVRFTEGHEPQQDVVGGVLSPGVGGAGQDDDRHERADPAGRQTRGVSRRVQRSGGKCGKADVPSQVEQPHAVVLDVVSDSLGEGENERGTKGDEQLHAQDGVHFADEAVADEFVLKGEVRGALQVDVAALPVAAHSVA